MDNIKKFINSGISEEYNNNHSEYDSISDCSSLDEVDKFFYMQNMDEMDDIILADTDMDRDEDYYMDEYYNQCYKLDKLDKLIEKLERPGIEGVWKRSNILSGETPILKGTREYDRALEIGLEYFTKIPYIITYKSKSNKMVLNYYFSDSLPFSYTITDPHQFNIDDYLRKYT